MNGDNNSSTDVLTTGWRTVGLQFLRWAWLVSGLGTGWFYSRYMNDPHGFYKLPGTSKEAIDQWFGVAKPEWVVRAKDLNSADGTFLWLVGVTLALLLIRSALSLESTDGKSRWVWRAWHLVAFVAIVGYVIQDTDENAHLARRLNCFGEDLCRGFSATALADAFRWKWGFLLVTAVCILLSFGRRVRRIHWTGGRPERISVDLDSPRNRPGEWKPNDERLGIALSGGGVRSASFSLGALQYLATDDVGGAGPIVKKGGLLKRATYVASVSGGGYIATAFTAANQTTDDETLETGPAGWEEGGANERRLRSSLRYLSENSATLAAAVGRILFGVFVNIWIVYSVLFVVARPVGWLVGSNWIEPGLQVRQPAAIEVTRKAPCVARSPMPDTPPTPVIGPASKGKRGAKVAFVVRTVRLDEQTLNKDRPLCVRVGHKKSSDTSEFIAGITQVAPALVVVRDGKLTVDRQAEFKATWPTTCPKVKTECVLPDDLIQPTGISLVVTGTRNGVLPGDDLASDLTWKIAPVHAKPVDILSRRGPVKAEFADASLGVWFLVCALMCTIIRIARRPPWYRMLNVIGTASAVVGLAVITVRFVIPWCLISVSPRIGDALRNGPGTSVTSSYKNLPLPGGGIGNLLAFVIFAGRALRPFLRRKGTSTSPNPAKKNALALTKKFGLIAQRIAIAAALIVLVLTNLVTILTVGALNGPTGKLTWLSETLAGTRISFPPDLVLWSVFLLALVGGAVLTETSSWSPAPIYRRRLANAFSSSREYSRSDPASLWGSVKAFLAPRAPSLENWQSLVHDQRSGFFDGDGSDGTEHIFCCAANIRGENRAPSGRNAMSFSVSRSYIGTPEIGWMNTGDYIKRLGFRRQRDFALPNLMAISGAAVSSGLGRQSGGARDSVLALMNVRLGQWLPNPAWVKKQPCGSKWLHLPGWPWFLRELVGRFSPNSQYLLVSDGGHWENLGLVELLRRGCKQIIVVSAAGDGQYSSATLGQAIEIARSDLGIEIQLDDIWKTRPTVAGSSDDDSPTYLLDSSSDAPMTGRFARQGFAYGTIKFPEPGDEPGSILVIEASMVAALPVDVLAYGESHPEFPNVSTGDQFFTNHDFEAYRVLGREIARSAFNSVDHASEIDRIRSAVRRSPQAASPEVAPATDGTA